MTSRKPIQIPKGSVHEARLINTRMLAATLAPGRKGQAALAKELERSPSQISHMIGTNPTKRIGENMAWEIEEAFHKPRYWLDHFHQDAESNDPVPPREHKVASEEMERVSDRLYQLGYKWADLARELGTNDQVVYNWRVRDGGIPKAHLAATARLLECSIDWLLTGADGPTLLAEPPLNSAPDSNPNSTVALMIEQLAEAHQQIGRLESELAHAKSADHDTQGA